MQRLQWLWLCKKNKIQNPSFKGGSGEETLMYNFHQTANFFFLSLYVYLLRTVLLSFWVTGSKLSHCFAVRNSDFIYTKNKTKVQFWVGKSKFSQLFAGCSELCKSVSYHRDIFIFNMPLSFHESFMKCSQITKAWKKNKSLVKILMYKNVTAPS